MTENGSTRRREDCFAFILYLLLICILYAPVFFVGKSMLPGLYQPHGVLAEGVYEHSGRHPVTSFNVDIGTPAYYEFPVNKLIGDIYKGGELPLWNPYQASGTPLAAQYSSRAFFPYQVIEDISPVETWDFFMLGRLLIAGFFTYLFLRALGLGFLGSFAGGIFYSFSGVFTWFINLEQLTNTAMMVPVVMYAVELMAAREPGDGTLGRRLTFAGLSFAGLLLAGQPEVALYVSLLAALYFLVRRISLYRWQGFGWSVVNLSFSYLLGLMLAAPLLVIFLEFVGQSYNIHPPGSGLGTEALVNWRSIFAYLNPTATEFVADPETILGMNLLVNLKGEFFRYMPINGVWDTLGGYTGVVPLYLLAAGLLSVLSKPESRLRGVLLFFVFFATVVVLKNIGVRPFVWLGALPLFDRVWTLRWASPAWIFAISAAAAIGLDTLKPVVKSEMEAAEEKNRGRAPSLNPGLVWLMPFVLIMGLYLLEPFALAVSLTLNAAEIFNPTMSPFVIPSILSGSIVTVLVLSGAFLMAFFIKGGTRTILYGITALAVLELWWAIPRGYTPEWLLYKWIPFVFGFAAAFLFALGRFRAAVFFVALFLAAFLVLDTTSPRGFPERQDPFSPAPYVEYLLEQGEGYRATGTYGALFPNYAGPLGLKDVHYVNSLVPMTYHLFRKEFLHAESFDEGPDSGLWFTGRPERVWETTRSEGRGTVKELRATPVGVDIIKGLRGYSLLGVRYLVVPKGFSTTPEERAYFDIKKEDGAPLFPLLYDKEIRIYENPYALKRAYVVYSFEYADSFEEAQKAIADSFDISNIAVLEEGSGTSKDGKVFLEDKAQDSAKQTAVPEDTVHITGESANTVTVEVTTRADGLLVLADVYYPGWRATVNGAASEVLRVNGLVRGVRVGPGKSVVEFRYRPTSFVVGVGIFLVALVLCAGLCLVPLVRRKAKLD